MKVRPQEITHELEERVRLHDGLVCVAYGHGLGLVRPLTDDGKSACLRIAQMILRGTSDFTPSEFGKPMGWDFERSVNAINEVVSSRTKQRVLCSDMTWDVDGVPLCVSRSQTFDANGGVQLTYHIQGLSRWLDDWADDGDV